MKTSALELQFLAQVQCAQLPEPKREYRFHPQRRWRFDFAWPEKMVAVEIEGGIWTGGRHVRGPGFIADCEKYNQATIEGWRVLRFTSLHLDNNEAIPLLTEILNGKE